MGGACQITKARMGGEWLRFDSESRTKKQVGCLCSVCSGASDVAGRALFCCIVSDNRRGIDSRFVSIRQLEASDLWLSGGSGSGAGAGAGADRVWWIVKEEKWKLTLWLSVCLSN